MVVITPVLVIDVIGVIIGLVSIGFLINAIRNSGKTAQKGLLFIIAGIGLNVLAFIYTIIFLRLKLYTAPPVDIHHALMTLGMLFFIMAAHHFFSMFRTR